MICQWQADQYYSCLHFEYWVSLGAIQEYKVQFTAPASLMSEILTDLFVQAQ